MLWRKKINDCQHCGGTGHMPTPRMPSEAPLYGDDTISCPYCRGEPSAKKRHAPAKGAK
jgi:hypothetical protein